MAYVASDVFIRFAQTKRTCSVVSIDKASYFLTESLALSKKSPYKRIFKAKYVLSLLLGLTPLMRMSNMARRSRAVFSAAMWDEG
jgi:hypothetical protein